MNFSFSLSEAKKQLRKAKLQQNIIKIQSLINDCLVKVNSLLGKAESKNSKEVVLLTQIANNLLKVQTKLEQLERNIRKTILENSSGGNFEG